MKTLTRDQASKTYDRIGSLQDTQRFYEDPATALVTEHGEFESADSVFEFGCGTGRYAERLLRARLPQTARYRGVDLSSRMVGLASSRLAPFCARAAVVQTDGAPPIDEPTASYDRFVSNFVFDLLSDEDIRAVLVEAHRILSPGGLLCLSGLSTGPGAIARFVAGAWRLSQGWFPSVLGGCRPVELLPFVEQPGWQLRYQTKVVAWGVPSEVLVANKAAPAPAV